MKKLMSGLAIGLIAFVLVPMGVKAYAIDMNNSKCEKVACADSATKCQSVCKIYIKDNTSVNEINLSITPKTGVIVSKVDPADSSWTVSGTKFTSVLPVTTANFQLATITIEYGKDVVDCSVDVSLDGKESTPIPAPKPESPKTGDALPIAILTCGAGLAAVIYLTVRKNTKLYKI